MWAIYSILVCLIMIHGVVWLLLAMKCYILWGFPFMNILDSLIFQVLCSLYSFLWYKKSEPICSFSMDISCIYWWCALFDGWIAAQFELSFGDLWCSWGHPSWIPTLSGNARDNCHNSYCSGSTDGWRRCKTEQFTTWNRVFFCEF